MKNKVDIKLLTIAVPIGVLICFCILSCNKFLDKNPNPVLVVPKVIGDVQALLDGEGTMNGSDVLSGEIASDNYNLNITSLDNYTPSLLANYTWVPETIADQYSDTYYDWVYAYSAILYANTALETLEKIPRNGGNATMYDNAKGSALFFRAYRLWKLATSFAKSYDAKTADKDLGLPVRLTSDFNKPSIRSSIADTYQQILADANASVILLPNTQVVPTRPSKAAAYGLLARIYLSMRNYTAAGDAANSSLEVNNSLVDYNSLDTTALIPLGIFNAETTFFMIGNNYNLETKPINQTFINLFAVNDLRRKINFRYYPTYQGYILKGNYTGNRSFFFTGIGADEVYMMRAECFARAGKVSEALSDLNTLMAKRYDSTFVPFTAANADNALNVILEERRKELFYRGLRWMDIKRLNLEGRNIIITRTFLGKTYTLKPNSNQYALPIPKAVIDIAGFAQN